MELNFMAKVDRYFDVNKFDLSINLLTGKNNSDKIEILRGCLWFYTSQIVTLGDMRKYFTDNAIIIMFIDRFIEFKTC